MEDEKRQVTIHPGHTGEGALQRQGIALVIERYLPGHAASKLYAAADMALQMLDEPMSNPTRHVNINTETHAPAEIHDVELPQHDQETA